MKKIDWPSVLLIVMLVICLIAGLIVTPTGLPKEKLCLFQRFMRLDCPACGLTRAFLCIPRGHFAEAWQLNAASIPLYALFVFLFINMFWRSKSQCVKYIRVVLIAACLVLLLWQWAIKIHHFVHEGDHHANNTGNL